MQRIRGLIAGTVVGVPLGIFMYLWLHAEVPAAAAVGGIVGVAILLVVGTRSDAHDEAADIAWREAALDLPPVSDRVILERLQSSMPGPGKQRKTVARPVEQSGAQPAAAGKGAEAK